MKHTLIVGAILAFVVLSFKAPTSGDYQALAEQVAIRPPETPIVVDVRLPTKEEVQRAFSSAHYEITHQVSDFDVYIDDGSGNITSTREVGGQVMQTVKDANPAQVISATKQFAYDQVKDLKSLLKVETDETMRHQLEIVDWASRKKDIGACGELVTSQVPGLESETGLTSGDLLAYCIARITKAKERCEQIPDTSILPLRSICLREVSSYQ